MLPEGRQKARAFLRTDERPFGHDDAGGAVQQHENVVPGIANSLHHLPAIKGLVTVRGLPQPVFSDRDLLLPENEAPCDREHAPLTPASCSDYPQQQQGRGQCHRGKVHLKAKQVTAGDDEKSRGQAENERQHKPSNRSTPPEAAGLADYVAHERFEVFRANIYRNFHNDRQGYHFPGLLEKPIPQLPPQEFPSVCRGAISFSTFLRLDASFRKTLPPN